MRTNGGASDFDVSPRAARLILLAALLTNFYFNAKAAANRPLGRPTTDLDDLDEAVLETDGPGVDALLARELASQCAWHCERSASELSDLPPDLIPEGLSAALVALLEDVQKSLEGRSPEDNRRQPVLKRMNLRLVTEVSWYFVMSEIGDYSGWSEILFGIMLRGVSGTVSTTRPHFVLLRGLASLVESMLLRSSSHSWEVERGSQLDDDFFGATAEVLWAESEVIELVSKVNATLPLGAKTDLTPPPAVAFVTGFDLELEMAMWRSAPLGSSFFVVVPVHVFMSPEDRMAQPCWIRGEVVKRSNQVTFDEFRTPEDWVLLTAKTDGTELCRGPHIVHLNGAPLIILPSEQRNIEGVIRAVVSGQDYDIQIEDVTVEHAVITDEYLAVRHAEVDLSFQLYNEKDAANRSDRSLPRLLMSSSRPKNSSKAYNPRFWVIAGVALGDPAVRYRLVSQLGFGRRSSANSMEKSDDVFKFNDPSADTAEGLSVRREDEVDVEGDEQSSIGFSGIVINRRITVDEASLLYWMGFDVIRDRAASFARDLRHYAAHLLAGGRKAWPPKDQACTIRDGGGR